MSNVASSRTGGLGRAYENGYNLEGPVFMDCFEHIVLSPRGMPRVKDKINEFLVEDVSADTIVSMLAAERNDSDCYTAIKQVILQKLKDKFSERPDRRIWLLMVCTQNLMKAVNSFPPFMEFILELISWLSKSIMRDPSNKTYYSPPGCITYTDLVVIMARFYRNPKTTQNVVNFVFNHYHGNSAVWGSILDACHTYPIEDTTTAENAIESLYSNHFTDPNVSSEALQLMLKSVLNTNPDLMASSWTPSKRSASIEQQCAERVDPQDFSDNAAAAAMELTDVPASLGPECIKLDVKPSNVKVEFPSLEIGPCCQSKDLFPVHRGVPEPPNVTLHQTPSNRWTVVDLESRPLSSRVKRYPKRMEDFWA